MAGGKEIRAGRAYVELSTRDKLTSGLRAAERRLLAFGSVVRRIGAALTAIGTAGVIAGVGIVNAFAKVGDAVADASARTGIGVAALSELAYAASLTGSSLEGFELAIKGMQRALYDAEKGSKASVDALADVGLTLQQLQGLKPDEQFLAIADALSKIEDPSRQAALAMKLLGKSGGQLLPLIAGGLEGIAAARKQAQDFGLVISPEDAKAAAEYSDAMDILKFSVQGVSRAIATALMPVLTPVIERTRQGVKLVMDWVRGNKELVATIFRVAAVTAIVGGGLIAVGLAISIAGFAFGGIATLIGLAGTALVAVKGAILAILSPLGLLTVGVIAVGAAVAHITGFIPRALTYLSGRFESLSASATEAFKGIRNALAGGDLQLAAKVLWLALKAAWQTGINALETTWAEFKSWFLRIATDAFYGAAIVLNDAIATMQTQWTKFKSFMATLFGEILSGGKIAFNELTGFVGKLLLEIEGKLDPTFDVEAAKKAMDQQTATNNRKVIQDQEADAAAIKGSKADRLAEIEANRALTESGLVTQAGEEDAKRKADREKAIAASETALAAARADYAEVIKQARESAIAAGADPDAPLFDSKQFLDTLKGGAGIAAGAGRSGGTFNAAGIQSLQSSSQDDRIAEATEATARHTARIAQLRHTFQ